MVPTPQDVLNSIVMQIKGALVSDAYEKVEHINMLAHYTHIDAFRSIVSSRELWLSDVRDTNDTTEIVEGAQIVAAALDEYGPQMFATYGSFDANDQFAARRRLLETDTHILSLCEHGSDRRTDRLEMWKAYGRDGTGLCLVLRKAKTLDQSAKGRFPVHWVPVEYERPSELRERTRRCLQFIKRIVDATPSVEILPTQIFGAIIAVCVVQLVFAHKNIAFEYEKELRFVRSRLLQELAPPDGAGYRDVVIQGAIRSKFVVPLRNYPEFGIDASLDALLDHIIVGPSSQQDEIRREVTGVLAANGLGHVPVLLSEIPYRATR